MAGDAALLNQLMQRSAMQPTALAFEKDNPYATLASYGPKLAADGANQFNSVLAQQQMQQHQASSAATDNASNQTDLLKSMLANVSKMPGVVQASAMKPGSPLNSLLGGLGPEQLAAMEAQLTASQAAEGLSKLGPGVKALVGAGNPASLDGVNNIAKNLGVRGGVSAAKPLSIQVQETPLVVTDTVKRIEGKPGGQGTQHVTNKAQGSDEAVAEHRRKEAAALQTAANGLDPETVERVTQEVINPPVDPEQLPVLNMVLDNPVPKSEHKGKGLAVHEQNDGSLVITLRGQPIKHVPASVE